MSGELTGPSARAARRLRPRSWQLLVSCVAAGLPALVPQSVSAEETGQAAQTAKVTPFVEETLTTDDNLFRISDAVDPVAVIGSPSRGDTYRSTSIGLTADVPVSLQRFQVSLSYNSNRYDRFHELDYDGYDLRGSWLWQVGSNLSGQLGATETYSLVPFSQLLGVAPNRMHLQEVFAKGSWLVTPDWKLYGSGGHLLQNNSDPAVQYNNVTVNSFEASLSRASGTGNWFGLDTRLESGHSPVAQPIGTVLVDNDYTQYGFGVVVDFGAETPSHVVARVDQVSRHFDQLTQRDFDGATGRLEYTWTPTGKLAVSAIAQRDISPYEYVRSSIVMVKGLTLRPLWHATTTLDLSADFAWLERSYLADPAVALGVAPPRVDDVRTLSALLAYNPARWISVQLSFLHETRSSNIQFGDYAADVLWLKLRLSL